MGLDQDIEHLRRATFLSVLDTDALRLLAFNAENRKIGDGDILFSQDEAAHSAFLLTDGQVALVGIDAKGEERHYRTAQAGDLLDPYALISRTKRSATGRAVGEVSCIAIDRRTFMRVMEEFPQFAESVHDFVADELNRNVSEYSTITARF